MKLVTFKAHTEERIGALVGDKVLDLTSAYASEKTAPLPSKPRAYTA